MGDEPSMAGSPSGPSGTCRTVLVVTVLTILVTWQGAGSECVNVLLLHNGVRHMRRWRSKTGREHHKANCAMPVTLV